MPDEEPVPDQPSDDHVDPAPEPEPEQARAEERAETAYQEQEVERSVEISEIAQLEALAETHWDSPAAHSLDAPASDAPKLKVPRDFEIGGPEETYLRGGVSPEQVVLQQEDTQARLRRHDGVASPDDHKLLNKLKRKKKHAK